MSCDPQNAAGNLRVLGDAYRKAEADGFTAAELSQSKSKIQARVVLASERPRGRLFSVGANWTHRGTYRSVKADLDSVDGVTLEAVNAVLAKYPLTRCTAVAVGPLASLAPPE
jgi:predicted Zn-dependent peptidase